MNVTFVGNNVGVGGEMVPAIQDEVEERGGVVPVVVGEMFADK